MLITEPQLLQRIRALGVIVVTFLVLGSFAHANPPGRGYTPSAVQGESPTLTLISPLDGLWDQLETYEPPSDDLLARLRNGFELEREDNRRIQAELKWFVSQSLWVCVRDS